MKKMMVSVFSMMLMLTMAVPVFAASKVLFIDSYHQGYAWSDGVQKGVEMGLDGKDVELKIVRMDTKRNTSDEFKKSAALKVKSEIEGFSPDVVISADDNASKFVIMPYYKDAKLPFVFCGVNWDASVYGFPYSNVTGMVEVAPVNELLGQLKQYSPGAKIGYVAADNLTTHKEADNYKAILGIDTVNYYAVDMEDWKKGFVELQKQVDTLIIGNTAGLPGWDEVAAEAFVVANTKVPSGAIDEHMAPYAMFGFVKIAEEQGFYAATAALDIIGGKSPKDIPIVKNKDGKLYVNLKIASAVGVEVPFEVLGSASKVIE